jgi:nicotinate-nucleotide adenylyltransferase
MRVGIFGGTFDPPHMGHLILAQEALEQLSLDQILWILTPFPPHKIGQKLSSLDDRIAMVMLAISGNSNFNLSRIDIDRQPPHYAVDTVTILRQNSPDDEFYYLMGADSLNDLIDWYEPIRFVAACHGIGVLSRCNETDDLSSLASVIPGIAEKVHYLQTPRIEISGSEIRKRASKRRPFRYFLPEVIYYYILAHQLYQS